MHKSNISSELKEWEKKITQIAKNFGLDFYEVIYEMVSDKEVNQLAALGGFPKRYPHWRFGMEYNKLSKSYEYGLSKIYEMVINTNPCYAYLLNSNTVLQQKLVMAHVLGHSDFFKNNRTFTGTDTNMMDVMANNAERIKSYQSEFGQDTVEEFLDICLSLDNLLDYRKIGLNKISEVSLGSDSDLSTLPQRDILCFLIANSDLSKWQVDCMQIVRQESYYFAPQMQTKIMNEGWATYWHSKIMTEKIMNVSEVVDYCCVHGRTVAIQPGSLNPYNLGLELFRDIEQRWNKGQYGKAWQECNDIKSKSNWDTKEMSGMNKIFEVRKSFNDLTFIDNFLTKEFCLRNKLFGFVKNEKKNNIQISTREFKEIKNQLLVQLTNFGAPLIEIIDSNYNQEKELYLVHSHYQKKPLREDYAMRTLQNIFSIWKKPIHLQTYKDEKQITISYSGK